MAKELDVPTDVADDDSFDEVLRVFIADDAVVQLRDIFGSNTHNWDMLLADVAIHIARMKSRFDDVPIEQTLTDIEDGYRGRMADQPNVQHRTLTGRN